MWKLKDLFKPNIDKMVAEKNVKSLIKLLSRGKNRSVRVRAVKALEKIRDIRAVTCPQLEICEIPPC